MNVTVLCELQLHGLLVTMQTAKKKVKTYLPPAVFVFHLNLSPSQAGYYSRFYYMQCVAGKQGCSPGMIKTRTVITAGVSQLNTG